uniref:Uncharacterized protein n=1 Tax=Panagrolaimus davidi TaxID=227884 RepID=A0A914PX37_9BILA
MATITSENSTSFPGPSSMMPTGTTTTTTSSRSLAQLPRYDQCVPVLKSTHDQMKKCISIDLLTACQREVNFLRMIDRKAPVLYSDAIVQNAIRRYEQFWLPMQKPFL